MGLILIITFVTFSPSLCDIGRNKEAIRVLEKAIKLNPNISTAHNNLAAAYYYEKNYDLDIKYYDKVIKLGYKVVYKFLDLLKPYKK